MAPPCPCQHKPSRELRFPPFGGCNKATQLPCWDYQRKPSGELRPVMRWYPPPPSVSRDHRETRPLPHLAVTKHPFSSPLWWYQRRPGGEARFFPLDFHNCIVLNLGLSFVVNCSDSCQQFLPSLYACAMTPLKRWGLFPIT